MTIKELIEKLKKFPENYEVSIQNGDDGGDYSGSRPVIDVENEEDRIVIY